MVALALSRHPVDLDREFDFDQTETPPPAPFNAGELVLLAGRPFIPPVEIQSVSRLPWGPWRVAWRHRPGLGFGRTPQRSDQGPERRPLLPVPAGYVAPPMGTGLSPAELAQRRIDWLEEHADLLTETFGPDVIEATREQLATSLAIARKVRDAMGRPDLTVMQKALEAVRIVRPGEGLVG